MSTCFPAVVPGACIGEDAGFADGWGWCGEVVGGGEPFVGESEDAGAEGFGDEVWEEGRVSVSAVTLLCLCVLFV